MCGEWITDPATGPSHDAWPDGLMRLSGLPQKAFPVIREPWIPAGGLTRAASTALELPIDTLVVVGLHDGAAANIGTGTVNPGDACLTLGTNFALRAVTGHRPQTDCFGYIVAPGQWAWVNSVPNVANQLDLVATVLASTSITLAGQHERLGQLVSTIAPSAKLPSLPMDDLTALPAAITTAKHAGFTDGEIYLSMLYTAAAGLRTLVDAAARDGAPASRFVATGGASRNSLLVRVLASVLKKPVEIGHPEAGLLGAGMVAAIGAGWYGTLSDAWRSMAPSSKTVRPGYPRAGMGAWRSCT